MSSETEICNLALSFVGSSKEIASLTENSSDARACRRFYETTRDAVLRDADWPFCTKIDTLGLVETDPNDEWSYSYRYPSDCLFFRRILSGSRNDDKRTRVAFRLAQDSTARLIFTDTEDAVGEWTIRVTDAAQFSPDFVLALALRLAAYIAPRLTGGDPFKVGEKAMRQYAVEIGMARSSAIEEKQPDIQPESEFITGRE